MITEILLLSLLLSLLLPLLLLSSRFLLLLLLLILKVAPLKEGECIEKAGKKVGPKSHLFTHLNAPSLFNLLHYNIFYYRPVPFVIQNAESQSNFILCTSSVTVSNGA